MFLTSRGLLSICFDKDNKCELSSIAQYLTLTGWIVLMFCQQLIPMITSGRLLVLGSWDLSITTILARDIKTHNLFTGPRMMKFSLHLSTRQCLAISNLGRTFFHRNDSDKFFFHTQSLFCRTKYTSLTK